MYAIIATGGKQYKVSEGDIVNVEKLSANEGDKVVFDQVIAVSGDDLMVGDAVSGATVDASVVKNGRGIADLEDVPPWKRARMLAGEIE